MAIREYLLSVTCAAFLCAIIHSLVGEKGQIKLLCSIFLGITVIHPLMDIRLSDYLPLWGETKSQAAWAVQQGESYSEEIMADIISGRTEAYILDKASAYGASVRVEVTVEGEGIPVPVSVRIWGTVSPYVKGLIQDMIQRDLGITTEAQIWMG